MIFCLLRTQSMFSSCPRAESSRFCQMPHRSPYTWHCATSTAIRHSIPQPITLGPGDHLVQIHACVLVISFLVCHYFVHLRICSDYTSCIWCTKHITYMR